MSDLVLIYCDFCMNSDNIGKKEIMVTHMRHRKHIKNNCRLSSLAYFPSKWPLWLSWFLGHRPHCGRPGLGKKGLTQNTNRNRVSDSCEPNVPLKQQIIEIIIGRNDSKNFSHLTKYFTCPVPLPTKMSVSISSISRTQKAY